MNIFGVGGAELVLIIIIMLVVAGPKRMIRWAYVIGQYVGKFRILWEQMVDVLQDEVDAAGLDVKIPKEIPTKQSLAKTATELIKPYAETLEKTADEVRKPIQETISETNKVVADAKAKTETATNVDLGTWDNKAQTSEEKAVVPDKTAESPSEKSNFGAWSQTDTPDSTEEREA